MPVVTGLKETGRKFDPQGGLNFKWGLTSDMVLDSTLNPDFSQIEADMPQNDVNQRYALYYPEKRPFFLEGKDYFDTPFELVYTRTIVDPQWGVKLTGKSKGTTVGLLSSMDMNSPEITISEPAIDEEEEEVEGPLYHSLVNIFRLKKDLFSESYIGVIATDKEAGMEGEPLTANYNRVAGVDGHLKFMRYNRLSFQAVGSMTKTAEETGLHTRLHPRPQPQLPASSGLGRLQQHSPGFRGVPRLFPEEGCPVLERPGRLCLPSPERMDHLHPAVGRIPEDL